MDDMTEEKMENPETLSEQNDAVQLEEKAKLADEYFNRLQRLQADFDNFRRRSQKEREELADIIAESVICKFLPVIDNLARAVTTARTANPGDTQIVAGIEMIQRQLEEILGKLQVVSVDAVGAKFDPQKHEAIMQVPDADKEDETIIEEFQKGYQLKNRIIRPSMVKVVKN
jgi:molecular chaperone GrpE